MQRVEPLWNSQLILLIFASVMCWPPMCVNNCLCTLSCICSHSFLHRRPVLCSQQTGTRAGVEKAGLGRKRGQGASRGWFVPFTAVSSGGPTDLVAHLAKGGPHVPWSVLRWPHSGCCLPASDLRFLDYDPDMLLSHLGVTFGDLVRPYFGGLPTEVFLVQNILCSLSSTRLNFRSPFPVEWSSRNVS